MTGALSVLLIVVAVVVAYALFRLSRSTKQTKKEAMADLEREKAELHTPDIIELVVEEVRELGIDSLPGSEGIDPTVLLRVWKRDRGGCGPDEGRFVVADGVDPITATDGDVTFECESVDSRE